MRFQRKKLEEIVSNLNIVLESEHFIVHFSERNPNSGKGFGIRGVRDSNLVRYYIDALERLYATMVNPPMNRQPPVVGSQGKTNVYIFNISDLFPDTDSPFMDVMVDTDLNDYVPYIGLPCRSDEPSTQAQFQWAAAAAIHEATHLFNYRERDFRDAYSAPWAWFDEGTSVFMETQVMSGNCDYLRFGMNWSDCPDVPLDHESAWYQSSMFVRYLAKRMGLGFISKVWMESEKRETPLEALTRLLQQEEEVFISADPDVRDIFASGYCIDSYFLWDYQSDGFAPEVYARYGERAVAESFELHAGNQAKTKNSLDHLACHYYRFYLDKSTSTFRINLKTDNSSGRTLLKGEIAVVTKEMGRGVVEPLRPQSSPESQLSAELTELTPKNINHLVLVITNCGTRAMQNNPDIEHDDGKKYTLEIAAGS